MPVMTGGEQGRKDWLHMGVPGTANGGLNSLGSQAVSPVATRGVTSATTTATNPVLAPLTPAQQVLTQQAATPPVTQQTPPPAPAAAVAKKKPAGKTMWFQYGYGQWARWKNGKLTFGGKPVHGQIVGNWEKYMPHFKKMGLLAGMPEVRRAPLPGMDSIYNRKLAELTFQKDEQVRAAQRAEADARSQYDLGMKGIGQQFNQSKQGSLASLAARGFGGSGVQGKAYADLVAQRTQAETDLDLEVGQRAWERARSDAQSAKDYFGLQNLNEQKLAQDRYKATHGTAPPKRDKGFKKIGSTWFYTSKNGVTISLGANDPRKKKPAKKKAK